MNLLEILKMHQENIQKYGMTRAIRELALLGRDAGINYAVILGVQECFDRLGNAVDAFDDKQNFNF